MVDIKLKIRLLPALDYLPSCCKLGTPCFTHLEAYAAAIFPALYCVSLYPKKAGGLYLAISTCRVAVWLNRYHSALLLV